MTTELPLAEFPAPEQVEGFWMWDKMHFPRPQTPLTQEVLLAAIGDGFGEAMDEFAYPMGMRVRVVNYYGYDGFVPQDLKGESMESRIARFKETVTREALLVGKRWETEWMPAVIQEVESVRTRDYASMDDDELLSSFEEARRLLLHWWYIHGWINLSVMAASWFADFYNEQLHPEDPTEPYQCLQGYETRSLDAGRGLWRLSRIVKESPALRRVFENTNAAKLPERFEETDEGRTFLRDFGAYLEEFGWRNDAFELAEPSWYERPTIPLNAVQGYIRLGEEGDPDLQHRRAAQRRDELLARARERLAGEPASLARFDELHEGARYNLSVTENHNFYIDQRGDMVLRLPILEIGRRLVRKGTLTGESDIFLLYQAEIRDGMAGIDQRPVAARRRSEMEQWSKVLPPPTLGEAQEPPTDDPFFEAIIVKMFGVGPEPKFDESVITGIGVSAGVASGVAKVVRSLDEASKLQQGDIMVCEMTMPAWTPLFSTVGAVVADTGGVLSHCAIVCREYRLPCVAQTLVGTSVITDGMQLTVDGSKGVVRIEASAKTGGI